MLCTGTWTSCPRRCRERYCRQTYPSQCAGTQLIFNPTRSWQGCSTALPRHAMYLILKVCWCISAALTGKSHMQVKVAPPPAALDVLCGNQPPQLVRSLVLLKLRQALPSISQLQTCMAARALHPAATAQSSSSKARWAPWPPRPAC